MMSDETSFGPAWFGWESYRVFADEVETHSRFFRSTATDALLADIRASSVGRETLAKTGQTFWRARLGCNFVERSQVDNDLTVIFDEAEPFGPAGMKPISNWNSEGRANPRGIPYLYMASSRDTALAEVRPWIGANISVARLRLSRDARIIDCSKYHDKANTKIILDKDRSKIDGIWLAIDQAFARPVNKEDESHGYTATQIVAEFFKSNGFDGIAYKSLLSDDGFNLVMFDLNIAEVIQTQLFKVDTLRYAFTSDGPELFPAK
jgi:hypothetical protein